MLMSMKVSLLLEVNKFFSFVSCMQIIAFFSSNVSNLQMIKAFYNIIIVFIASFFPSSSNFNMTILI